MTIDDVSVALQFHMEDASLGPSASRSAFGQAIRRELGRPGLIEGMCADLGFEFQPAWMRELEAPTYIARLAESLDERARIGRDAPGLRIAPVALTAEDQMRCLPGPTRLAVIFGAEAVLLQDTLESLATEAASHRMDAIALRPEWRAADLRSATRALIVDGSGTAKDVVFEEPLRFDRAIVLHLGDAEMRMHESVSRECRSVSIPQANPYPAALRADDKMACHRLWRDAGLDTPRATLISRAAPPQDIRRVLAADGQLGDQLYILPNRGTEGKAVERFTASESEAMAAHIVAIHDTDDALVRAEKGNVWFGIGGDAPRLRRVVFRVNVARGQDSLVAESGYAQVAAEGSHVASRGRNGEIVSIDDALRHLWHRAEPEDGECRPVAVAPGDLARLREVCEAGARALNRGLDPGECLRLLGLDVVPEVNSVGGLEWVLLEANPRPAGLNHSRWLPTAPGESTELGVTQALFHGLGDARPRREGRDAGV